MKPWRDHLPDGTDLTVDDLGAEGTLVRAWTARWAEAPGAPLWFDSRTPPPAVGSTTPTGSAGWWTAAAFEEATGQAAGRLLALGLAPGDRILWSTTSAVAALASHVGALRAGLVVVPVNSAYSERELAHIVGDVRPAAAIVERADQVAWVERASGGSVRIMGPEVGDPRAGPRVYPDDRLLDGSLPGDPALICYTSGTTGTPKGAVLSHRNLLCATRSVTVAWRWNADDRLVHCLPVFHAHGLAVGVYGTLLAGASAVLLPGFDPEAVDEAAGTHRASLFFGVPTMYHRLIGSGRGTALHRMRLCVSGSAPLSRELHAAASSAVGTPVLERYGMTETLMNVSNPYSGERRAGTVGFPLPGVEVRLSGDGEVLVRGPNVFSGYWERPEANAEAFSPADEDADGGEGGDWFHTGDLGADEDGYLVIRGRSKELIITGGFNVYPTEVEDVLVGHPGVAEVAVTGTPSPEWGEVVTAWIVPDGTAPTAEELAEFASSSLASFKRPRLVHVVEALPRNGLGKVVRSLLGT